jgi:hypothetical protein
MPQSFENGYQNPSFLPFVDYTYAYAQSQDFLSPPLGAIPIQLDIEGLYGDYDRRRKGDAQNQNKNISSHVHSVSLPCFPLNIS